jgi:pimeloyl-ACP methyl ester carboxylesterase
MCELWRYACALADPDLFYFATLPLNFGETFIRGQTAILEQAKVRYAQLDFPPLVRLIDSFLDLNITDQLPQIKVPTCVIAGAEDILKPAYPYSKLIHDSLPNSEMTIIEDSGHAVTFEQPEEFNRVVLEFLGRQNAP